jgi:hypothetical protein
MLRILHFYPLLSVVKRTAKLIRVATAKEVHAKQVAGDHSLFVYLRILTLEATTTFVITRWGDTCKKFSTYNAAS